MELEFIAFVLGIVSLLTTLWIWAEQRILRRYLDQEKTNRQNHGREEIYRILRNISAARQWRERIRQKPKGSIYRGVTREVEILFVNKRVIRTIHDLSLTLLLYNEYFPEQFIKRVNDAISAYDFILSRLDLMPMEIDDPAENLNDKDGNEGFIDELKNIK